MHGTVRPADVVLSGAPTDGRSEEMKNNTWLLQKVPQDPCTKQLANEELRLRLNHPWFLLTLQYRTELRCLPYPGTPGWISDCNMGIRDLLAADSCSLTEILHQHHFLGCCALRLLGPGVTR